MVVDYYSIVNCQLVSFIVAPAEVLFIASPLAFDGLHGDIKILLLDTCTGSY